LKININHSGQDHTIDLNYGIDLSISNRFDGNYPTFYSASAPSVHPVEIGEFVGDLNRGGSCNVKIASLNIHCTGTHTECIGHIDKSGTIITDVCPKGFLFSQLITVKPVQKSNVKESYHVECEKDFVISKESIIGKIINKTDTLIIRTLLNDTAKLNWDYDKNPAPFFTHEAIKFIIEKGIKHLLVDLPSIDKADDGGQLGNHYRFFEIGKTISELLFIPDSVQDGLGFLQIQIPNWGLDAAPSRPIFYPI
jgi:arylformamidase